MLLMLVLFLESIMNKIIVIAFMGVVGVAISACGIAKPSQKVVQDQAQQAGLIAVKKSRFDTFFVFPQTNFSQYKKIIISALDVDNIKILKPSMDHSFDEPWELNDEDKRYYQRKYAEAVQQKLIDTHVFSSTQEAGLDTLRLNAKITQIAPLASKDDAKGRPMSMKVYSEGVGRMTIAFEIYDSVTQKLIATASDEHDLGKLWKENNRVEYNAQIRLAFDYWLNNVKSEFEKITKQ
jgi:Protein of unknown function (DUF3313)